MGPIDTGARSAWTVADLNADTGWIQSLDDGARRDLIGSIRAARDPDKKLFDYARADFDLGRAWSPISRCLREIKEGRGFALLRGLPRDGLSSAEFELLTWAIGLH